MSRSCTLFTLALLIISGCGGSSGGGSTGNVTGLSVATQMSVVTPDSGSGSSSTQDVSQFDPTSDYFTDGVDVAVYDPSIEPLLDRLGLN